MDTIDETKLPPTPDTGLCLCGAAYYFQRSGVIGRPGHFHCKRCGRRYRMNEEEPWHEVFRERGCAVSVAVARIGLIN